MERSACYRSNLRREQNPAVNYRIVAQSRSSDQRSNSASVMKESPSNRPVDVGPVGTCPCV